MPVADVEVAARQACGHFLICIIMVMHFSKLFKIKEGKLDTFVEWMRQLDSTRKEEALATFAAENVLREAYILFRGPDGSNYVIGFNEASGDLRPGDPTVSINQEHTAIKKECFEAVSQPGEILLDLRV